jgi:hypothetical protein
MIDQTPQNKSIREANYSSTGELENYKYNPRSKTKMLLVALFLLIVLILVVIVLAAFSGYLNKVFTFLHS